MSLLSVKSLSVTLGLPLVQGLSFTLAPGDRLGLIAANGRGKSSLLRCLAGQLDPTSGDITRARGATVALVEQDATAALLALSLRDAVTTASHDRAFLDAVTSRSLFLRAQNSRTFARPYSAARAALAEADLAQDRQFGADIAKADQLRRQAAKLKNIGINSGSDLLITKTKQLKTRAERIEAAARPAHKDPSAGAIRLTNSGTHAKALLTNNDTEITTPDLRPLFKTGQKWIGKGDRVVLLGRNGAGKTQMITALLHAITQGHATIKSTPTLALGHSDQALAQLPPKATPFDLVTAFKTGDAAARSLLAGAGIRQDAQSKPLAPLSGGQKARLAMLLLRLQQPNFYLLDEPTNHLDIEGQEALEAELLSQGATCLLVSHDRSFVRNVGSRFWLIDKKRLTEVDDPEAFFSGELG